MSKALKLYSDFSFQILILSVSRWEDQRWRLGMVRPTTNTTGKKPKLHVCQWGLAESSPHTIKDNALIYSGLQKIMYFHSIIIANIEHLLCVTVLNILYALFTSVLTITQWTRYYYHLHFIDHFSNQMQALYHCL